MQTIYTIGHSTRPIPEFVALLEEYSITQLVDIRTIPKSRHNPQFNQAAFKKSLKKVGIDHFYIKELGGLRPSVKSSENDAWINKSFRNYADYMQTTEFMSGLEQLLKIAKNKPTAIMCAEAVPWRCHRNLVSDALVIREIPVCEIIDKSNARQHKLVSFAVVQGTQITYPKSALEPTNEETDG